MAEVNVSVEEFFLNSGSEQLEKIHGWAKARYAAPWAVFGGVLLRVAASVPHTVQLPGLIGGRASLNLLCAFVGPSGSGKGNATKVAALAWPTDIQTLALGSGQGIAEAFTKRDKNAEIVPVIFDASEIDTLTGLSSTHGSILLPTLKNLAMGEQLGQANATKDARRNVPAQSYRACLSVGAQPGHTDIIFDDKTGGTPQRFLWMPATDENIKYGKYGDPDPLTTDMPIWTPGSDGVVDIVYSDPEIEPLIINNHIARQHGKGDALDGQATLTRCKVAALLAIIHQRAGVTEWDWRLSAAVMAVSDTTRAGLVEYAEQERRERARGTGAMRAAEREGYEDERLRTVMRAIVEKLTREGGEMAKNNLRSSLSTGHRQVFDSAIQKLADDGVIVVDKVRNGERYRLTGDRQGGGPYQGMSSQFNEGGEAYQGGAGGNVISLQNSSSRKTGGQKVSCQKWFDQHIAELIAAGKTTVESFAVYEAGRAAGYKDGSLNVAKTSRADIEVIERRGRNGNTWSLTKAA
ncbi:MAG: hypothetical protein WCE30_18760 [Mycobacterium sp.]